MANLLLCGTDVPTHVRLHNTFARPLRDRVSNEPVDIIVANPPHGFMRENGIGSNFRAEFRTRGTVGPFVMILLKPHKPGRPRRKGKTKP